MFFLIALFQNVSYQLISYEYEYVLFGYYLLGWCRTLKQYQGVPQRLEGRSEGSTQVSQVEDHNAGSTPMSQFSSFSGTGFRLE